jgi:hypothetical protein
VTVYGLVASLVWAAVVGGAVFRVLPPLVRAWLAVRYPAAEPSLASVSLPKDIIAFVESHGDEWAKEDVRKVAQQKYASLADVSMSDEERWNLVRRAIGIGGM